MWSCVLRFCGNKTHTKKQQWRPWFKPVAFNIHYHNGLRAFLLIILIIMLYQVASLYSPAHINLWSQRKRQEKRATDSRFFLFFLKKVISQRVTPWGSERNQNSENEQRPVPSSSFIFPRLFSVFFSFVILFFFSFCLHISAIPAGGLHSKCHVANEGWVIVCARGELFGTWEA